MNILIRCLFLIGIGLLYSVQSGATTLETLMMPGKLIKDHEKYENDCNKCHELFSKSQQKRLCLDCHKKIAGDISKNEGFHGRIKDVKTTECKICHTDHRGRDVDVVQLDKETFDHDETDFALKDAHKLVKCASCHESNKKYRDAPSACNDCHKKNDPHDGKLGKECNKCHDTKAWTKAKFDHDKTDFPLRDKHKKALCSSCHPNERYKNISTECYACHRLNDVHNGRYGQKCKSCHNAKDWKTIIFNHDEDTKYKLQGKHIKVACNSCHVAGNIYKEKLGTKCFDCHKNDDKHKGKYGKKCESCHSTEKWSKTKFDHDKDTDYPLKGKHEKVDCIGCHKGDAYDEELKSDCHSCHKQDDVHKGQEGEKCNRCHNEKGWSEKVVFHHDLTKFPLIGLHATTPCEECHLDAAFKNAALYCFACHKADDEHKKKLGTDCALCHNPNGWSLWQFDHDKQTDYKLDGAHRGLDCHACHKWPVNNNNLELSSTCGSCHIQDDVHDGGFGKHCERCHITKSFDEIKLNP